MRREFADTDLGSEGFPSARRGSDDHVRSPDKSQENAPALVFGEIGTVLGVAAVLVMAVNTGLAFLHIH